ncbi:FkbM family methyltransferase [bacterium]|nr:FkbM family methyltransferase [bacterium]
MTKKFVKIIKNIVRHPHARKNVLASFSRFLFWQLTAPKKNFRLYLWQNGIKVFVRRGMTGFTGNIYCEYYEYEDMMLLRHKSNDFQHFIDVGANVGAYTLHVLNLDDSKTVISFEPLKKNFEILKRNVGLNDWQDRWIGFNKCVGPSADKVLITSNLDTKNQVVSADTKNESLIAVDQIPLDEYKLPSSTYMKIDVEGYEPFVLMGAMKTLKNKNLKLIIIESVDDNIERVFIESGFRKCYYDVEAQRLTKSKPKDYFTKNTIFSR